MPWLRNHRSASFLKSSLSSMKRTRVMSAGKDGEMRILCKAPRTIHRKLKTGVAAGSRNEQGLAPRFVRISARIEAGTPRLVCSVERERVPGGAVPGDAVPRDAVPGDAVPGDAVPGDAVPDDAVPGEGIPGGAVPEQAVPGEQRPENAAGQRILPLQRRTKKDRVERAGETVRGPQSAIGTGYGSRAKERADQEPTQEHRVGRCIARHGDGGGVRLEQPAAVRYRLRENMALPVGTTPPYREGGGQVPPDPQRDGRGRVTARGAPHG